QVLELAIARRYRGFTTLVRGRAGKDQLLVIEGLGHLDLESFSVLGQSLFNDGDRTRNFVVFFLNAGRQIEDHELQRLLLRRELQTWSQLAALGERIVGKLPAAKRHVHVAEHHAAALGLTNG